MSADEIRRLAADALSNGIKIRAALLAYAAMVERCEEKIKYLESIRERGDTEVIDIELEDMNYILKGATDERK